jgi:hypothetical protein
MEKEVRLFKNQKAFSGWDDNDGGTHQVNREQRRFGVVYK